MIKTLDNLSTDELNFLKDTVNKLNDEDYADECYELDSKNIIIGIAIREDDLSLFLTDNCLCIEDANNGNTLKIEFDADCTAYFILDKLKRLGITIMLRDTNVACFGNFFKPNYNSELSEIKDETDVDMLCYLLEFLQNKGTLNLTCDFTDGLTEILKEWNNLPKAFPYQP